MSGPGLNQKDAHHAIHQAAFREAEQLTLTLRHTLRTGDQQHATWVAAVLIEHWQTRTLRHADAEETGWYREILAERPELQNDVIALTRDHELLRILLAEIQGILSVRGIAAGVVERFEAMLLLNGIHSRSEEQRLLGGEFGVETPGAGNDPHFPMHLHELPAALSGDDHQPGTTEGDTAKVRMPLSVARPALYERLSGFLRERGLNPADFLAELRANINGNLVLHIGYGQAYAQAGEWPLPDDVDNASDAKTTMKEAMLRQIAEACERATKTQYHDRMRTPT